MVSSLAGLGFFLALTTNIALAEKTLEIPTSPGEHMSQFQKIEQPISLYAKRYPLGKLAVVLGGLSLISAELWWFIFSKTKSQKALKNKI